MLILMGPMSRRAQLGVYMGDCNDVSNEELAGSAVAISNNNNNKLVVTYLFPHSQRLQCLYHI